MKGTLIVAPDRLPYELWKPAADREVILNWLDARGPDDWHAAAAIWNWDGGYDILGIICEQPDCDRATAQMVFKRAEPAYYLIDQTTFARASQSGGSAFRLALDILRRWRAGFYKRAELGLPEADARGWPTTINEFRKYAVERWNNNPDYLLPDRFLAPAAGRQIDLQPYSKIMPDALLP